MPKKLTPYQIMRQQMDRNFAQMYDTALARKKAVKPKPIIQAQPATKVYPTPKQMMNQILIGNKKKRSQYDIIGDKTYNELKDMTKTDLINDIKILQKQANTRLTQISKADEESFAKSNIDEKYLKDNKFKVDFNKMNKNQLIGYFNELNRFLTSKTSTVKGVQEVRKNINDRLNINFNKEQQDRLWDIYNKVKERNNAYSKDGMNNLIKSLGFEDSNQVQKWIAEKFVNSSKTPEEVVNEIDDYIKSLYEKEQEENYEPIFDSLRKLK